MAGTSGEGELSDDVPAALSAPILTFEVQTLFNKSRTVHFSKSLVVFFGTLTINIVPALVTQVVSVLYCEILILLHPVLAQRRVE